MLVKQKYLQNKLHVGEIEIFKKKKKMLEKEKYLLKMEMEKQKY